MNDNELHGIQPLSEISGSARRLRLCGGSGHCHSCLGRLGLFRLTHGHQQKARQEVEQTTRYLVRPLRTSQSTAHTALSGPQNLYLPWMSSRNSCGHGTQRGGASRSPRSASALALHLLGPRSEDSRVEPSVQNAASITSRLTFSFGPITAATSNRTETPDCRFSLSQ